MTDQAEKSAAVEPPTANEQAPAQSAAAKPHSRAVPILAGLLIAQLALIAWLLWPQPSQAAAGLLLADFDPVQVNNIAIKWEDKALELARSGDGWVLPEQGNYPANPIQVTDLLTKVAQIDTSRLVASTAGSHERLRVDDKNPIRRIAFTTSDGKVDTLYLGTSPNARATNVRADGSDNVYLTSALSTGDVRVDLPAWVDIQYLSLDSTAVNQLSFDNANGTFTLTRDGAGAWKLPDLAAGEKMLSTTVDSLVSSLVNLSLNDVLGVEAKPAYGLDAPLATVTIDFTATAPLTGTDAITGPVQLLVGAKDDASGGYAVKASTSPYFVRVAAATLDPFVQGTRASLVAAAPEGATLPLSPSTALTATLPLTGSNEITP